MGLSTKQIYEFYYTAMIARNPQTLATVLRSMLVESLSPLRRNVYEQVYNAGKTGITAQQITNQIRGNLQSTDNALKELYDLDLIIRSEMHDAHGLYYLYRIGIGLP